jgi:hypothetical protein
MFKNLKTCFVSGLSGLVMITTPRRQGCTNIYLALVGGIL